MNRIAGPFGDERRGVGSAEQQRDVLAVHRVVRFAVVERAEPLLSGLAPRLVVTVVSLRQHVLRVLEGQGRQRGRRVQRRKARARPERVDSRHELSVDRRGRPSVRSGACCRSARSSGTAGQTRDNGGGEEHAPNALGPECKDYGEQRRPEGDRTGTAGEECRSHSDTNVTHASKTAKRKATFGSLACATPAGTAALRRCAGRSVPMRPALVSICFVAFASVSIAVTWVTIARADAESATSGQAIVTTNWRRPRLHGSMAACGSSSRGSNQETRVRKCRPTATASHSPAHVTAAPRSMSRMRDPGSLAGSLTIRSRRTSTLPGRPTAAGWFGRAGSQGTHDLFVMDADGTRKQRFLADDTDAIEPAWSPDATQVAFASRRGGRYQLWTVAVADNAAPALIVEAPGQMRAPAWNPQGTLLAYTGVRGGNNDVCVTPLDGSTPTRATIAAGFDGRPTWSPDGKAIAFVSRRDGTQRIWLMRANGSGQRPLADSKAGDDTPDWGVVDESILPSRGSLLPDLDQQAPSDLIVMHTSRMTRLGFASAVDNIGDGPLHIRGPGRGPQGSCGPTNSSTGETTR